MAQLADSEATIRHLISQLDARTARAEAAEQDTADLHQRFSPLCPCVDAPEQECPLHGDGVTFVAYVQRLEALAGSVRRWDTYWRAGAGDVSVHTDLHNAVVRHLDGGA